MATDTGIGYATQTPFGCATPRLVASVNIVSHTCYGVRSDQVDIAHWQAVGTRSDQVDIAHWQAVVLRVDVTESGAYPLNARCALLLERVAIGHPLPGAGGAEPVPATGQLWPVAC